MPFGLVNAPSTFQRLMDTVLCDLKWKCAIVYIDDIIIYSPSFLEHIQHLRQVFDRLRKANLSIKISKCSFCKDSLKFLGYVATQNGIKVDEEKTIAIKAMPAP